MRSLDRQAMVLVAVTLVLDQLTKQLLLGYLMAVDGHMVPMITWDQYRAEGRKQQEELIRQRTARLDTRPKE